LADLDERGKSAIEPEKSKKNGDVERTRIGKSAMILARMTAEGRYMAKD